MVRLIKIFLLFIWVSSFGQLSFYFNDKDFSVTKGESDDSYYDEYFIILQDHIKCYRISKADTILLYSSIGCTHYEMDNKSLSLYVWVDDYYYDECFCEGEEEINFCMRDTSMCNIKIKFKYIGNKLICSLSDLRPDYYIDTMVEFKQALNAISSSKFCKLTFLNKIFKKKCFDSTIDTIGKYGELFYSFYYDFAIYYLKTNNKKGLSRLIYNTKYYDIQYNKRISAPINYINNIIKYLWPMRNKEFINEDISIFSNNIKKIILLSYPDAPKIKQWK